MLATPLHRKPIFYGSDLADWGFMVLLVLHLLPAALATVAGILALKNPKGGDKHIQWGVVFVWTMIATALTGIALDVIRLSFFVEENHQKYTGYGMPSTYPARIAFLYGACCVIYLAKFASYPLNLMRENRSDIVNKQRWLPLTLFVAGVLITGLIYQRYNPWTGGLWIVWTFMAAVFFVGLYPALSKHYADFGVHQHRFAMLCLAAFSWWGALQGFGPAVAMAVMGVDNSNQSYTGNLPGDFSWGFFLFLAAWLPPFIFAAHLGKKAVKSTSNTF